MMYLPFKDNVCRTVMLKKEQNRRILMFNLQRLKAVDGFNILRNLGKSIFFPPKFHFEMSAINPNAFS